MQGNAEVESEVHVGTEGVSQDVGTLGEIWACIPAALRAEEGFDLRVIDGQLALMMCASVLSWF